ncbi:hypothetical protein H6F77_16285 [Microcoleus sp. FACHB-831]|uniref:hypothetical protein n=1 Tax=Microcoleus sp. FACHB-831 TaxID=2692827 RepID=UPI0016873137|nr:hypothetical protein [Microcoleus sp. FACHB-831]MBD1922621.1 hypothetical protein [Microcoleus sp. FACHB-831]
MIALLAIALSKQIASAPYQGIALRSLAVAIASPKERAIAFFLSERLCDMPTARTRVAPCNLGN